MNYLRKPKRGFCLGKFYPPTLGHGFMFDFGEAYCEELDILVCSLPSETIPGHLRYQWVQEMQPRANVKWCPDDLPQEPKDEQDDKFWATWVSAISRYMNRKKYDVVFASEHYGNRLAKELGARFVPVDISRSARAISGTKIRSNPFAYWDFIPKPVRPYFSKRVCLFGPESTGKSTLATQIGSRLHTIVAPEYGRTYTETFGADVSAEDLRFIVEGHLASVTAAKKQANRILVEDTDPVMTAVWSDMLIGERHPWFAQYDDLADLYILTDVDIPWVDDGTRYFKNDDDRQRFFATCENELISRGVDYVKVSGSPETRLQTAISAIQKRFGIW